MGTRHKIIIGDSRKMAEIKDESVNYSLKKIKYFNG